VRRTLSLRERVLHANMESSKYLLTTSKLQTFSPREKALTTPAFLNERGGTLGRLAKETTGDGHD
jgi:hypothetical protein